MFSTALPKPLSNTKSTAAAVLLSNAKGEAIIKHVIGLFHDLGAKVVAEGVETKEQLEFLLSVDCDMIQGYYFYKPMPEEEFVKLL